MADMPGSPAGTWIGAAATLFGAIGSARTQSAIAKSQREQAVAEWQTRASQSKLAQAIQNINNKRMTDNLDRNLKTAGTNLQRLRQGIARGNFESFLSNTDQMGAVVAHTASLNIGGNTADALERTTRMMQQRKQHQDETNQQAAVDDALAGARNMQRQTFEGLDMTVHTSGGMRLNQAAPTQNFDALSALANSGIFNVIGGLFNKAPAEQPVGFFNQPYSGGWKL